MFSLSRANSLMPLVTTRPCLRRGGHHLPAGADAEGEDRPAAGQVAGELIGGGGQAGVSGVLLVLGGVAVRLPVLDADAHGKGLGLHGDAPAVEHLKGVPGGVAGAEDQLAAGQGVGALPGRSTVMPRRAPSRMSRSVRLAFKPDVRTQVQQLPPQVLQGDVEVVRAHMGLGVDEDVLRRAAARPAAPE